MKLYWLVLGILGVWRITHLLQAEDGPWDLVARLRRIAGSGFWGNLMDCFLCLSLWIAVPWALISGESWKERLALWPALSAGAVLLQRLTSQTHSDQSQMSEEDHAFLLRTEARGSTVDSYNSTKQ
jgi:hypothetical protein